MYIYNKLKGCFAPLAPFHSTSAYVYEPQTTIKINILTTQDMAP
jgi:hypothetical protein